MRKRQAARAGEAGFTLVELLVGVAIVGLIAAAILGVQMVLQRSTFFATASEDAQASARAALDRMAQELRSINTGRQGDVGAITVATPTSITFLGFDLAATPPTLTADAAAGATTIQVSSAAGLTVGKSVSIAPFFESHQITAAAGNTLTLDGALELSYAAAASPAVRAIETLSYTYTANGRSGRLTRTVGGVADAPLLDNLSAFQLTYWDGSTPAVQTAVLDQIRDIRVQMTTTALSGNQTASRAMTITVRPRNLSRIAGDPSSGL